MRNLTHISSHFHLNIPNKSQFGLLIMPHTITYHIKVSKCLCTLNRNWCGWRKKKGFFPKQLPEMPFLRTRITLFSKQMKGILDLYTKLYFATSHRALSRSKVRKTNVNEVQHPPETIPTNQLNYIQDRKIRAKNCVDLLKNQGIGMESGPKLNLSFFAVTVYRSL